MSKNKYGGVNDMPTGWTKSNDNKRVYMLWFDMLRRCYDKEQQKRSKGSAYSDCTVCAEWFYLSEFYKDIQTLQGYSEWKSNGKMSIDKDLHSRGAKEYSLKTCCFVPISENIAEMNRRNPNITLKANQARQTKYVLYKGGDRKIFDSEKSACEYLGVRQCTISSCYRKGHKCKKYSIAKMGGKEPESE